MCIEKVAATRPSDSKLGRFVAHFEPENSGANNVKQCSDLALGVHGEGEAGGSGP